MNRQCKNYEEIVAKRPVSGAVFSIGNLPIIILRKEVKIINILMKKYILSVGVGVAGLIVSTGIAMAAGGYTLFGNATLVHPGNASNTAAQLSSTCPSGYPTCFSDNTFTYSGINFTLPSGATLGNLGTLSTDYNVTTGDCGGGAPRFALNYDNNPNTNIFVYIGPTPSFTGCALNTWQNTGNFIGSSELRFDSSQLAGGAYGQTYAQAVAVASSHTLTGISLVVDGGWQVAGNVQTVLVDNTVIGSDIYTFEPSSKEACKGGGWKNFTFAPGPFKNQGDCVSYFATGGKNQ